MSIPTLPDSIARAQQGDRDAFEAVYRHAVGRVHALALRLEGGRGDAEDLTQDVFVRVWRALPTYRGDAAFDTWVHGIAARTAIDRYRRNGWHAEVASGAEDPDRQAGPWAPRNLDLDAAIRALPAGMRRFFVLHAVAGYALREVAELAGVSIGTVQSQVFDARRKLRAVLGGRV